MNLKITHKLGNLFVKGFKRLKLIFDRKQQLVCLIHPFDICLNQESLVGCICAGGICMMVGGGTVLNTLRVCGTEKREGGTKLLKQWGQAGSRGWCL